MRTLSILVITAACRLGAASLSWTGGTSNVWTEGSNWTPDLAPSSSDDLTITTGAPIQTSNWNIGSGGSVTIDGGDVTWSGRFNTIGNGSAGSLLITSGSLTVNYLGGSSHAFNIGNAAGEGQRLLRQEGGTVNAINSNDEIFIKATGIYEISGGNLNAGSIITGFNNQDPQPGTFKIIGGASTINLDRAYVQSSAGTLEVEIDGSISPINAATDLSLAGTLKVEFASTPGVNDTFDLITYGGTLSGTFDTFDTVVDSPEGPDSVTLSINYGSGQADTVSLTVTAVGGDNTSPTLDFFANNVADGPIFDTQTVIYTVTFSEAMDASTVGAVDFENIGTATGTINSVTPTGNPAVFEVSLTPQSSSGTLQLQIIEGANLADPSGNLLDTAMAITDPVIITINPDTAKPTVTSIANNVDDGPIFDLSTVTYTVIFSEAMNASTIDTSDFENAGSPSAAITSVNPTGDPAVFQVTVLPGSGSGTLQLQVREGANLEDLAGLALDTTPAITDPVTIMVLDNLTTPLVWEGGTSNDWLDPTNWIPSQGPASSDHLEISSGTPVQAVNWNISEGGRVTINGGEVTWSGRFNTVGNGSEGSLVITAGSLTVNYDGGQSHAFNVGNGGGGGQRLIQQQGGTLNAVNSNDEIFIKNDGIYEMSDGILNAGALAVGTSGAGTFKIIGNSPTINLTRGYTQSPSGTLDLEIDGGLGEISAAGDVTLDGSLKATFRSQPRSGQTFTVMRYGGTLSGAFTTFDPMADSPAGPDTVTISIDYGSGSNDAVVLRVERGTEPLALKVNRSGDTLDFEWTSLAGRQYDLLSSSDLSTAPVTWLPYDDGVMVYENLPATGTTTTLSGVRMVGTTRYFALIEK